MRCQAVSSPLPWDARRSACSAARRPRSDGSRLSWSASRRSPSVRPKAIALIVTDQRISWSNSKPPSASLPSTMATRRATSSCVTAARIAERDQATWASGSLVAADRGKRELEPFVGLVSAARLGNVAQQASWRRALEHTRRCPGRRSVGSWARQMARYSVDFSRASRTISHSDAQSRLRSRSSSTRSRPVTDVID